MLLWTLDLTNILVTIDFVEDKIIDGVPTDAYLDPAGAPYLSPTNDFYTTP